MDFIKQIFVAFSKDQCTTLAAALAYYTAFALPPLLYLLLTVLTFGLSVMYEGEQARAKAESVLKSETAQLLGNPTASESIVAILENNEQDRDKWWKTLLSLAGIIVGATGVVVALQTALNQVWEVQRDPERAGIVDMVLKRILSLAMILGLGFLLLVSLVVSSILAAVGDQLGSLIGFSATIASSINFSVQAVVVLIVFAAIFKFIPDAIVAWRDVLVGAAVTTVLFLLGRTAMTWYFSYSSPGAHLGSAAASLAVLLAWVYYTAITALLGAEVTQVYALRYGARIEPEKGAVRVVREIKRPERMQ